MILITLTVGAWELRATTALQCNSCWFATTSLENQYLLKYLCGTLYSLDSILMFGLTISLFFSGMGYLICATYKNERTSKRPNMQVLSRRKVFFCYRGAMYNIVFHVLDINALFKRHNLCIQLLLTQWLICIGCIS